MTTMKAIVQETYGSADVLELRDVDRPTPGAGEVLVRVHAAGISRGDVHLMTGRALPGARRRRHPRPKNPLPGQDVAGTVVAIGAGRHPLRRRRRGLRHRPRVLRRVRRRPRGQARAQAGDPLVRPGRGDADLGPHGAARDRRRRVHPVSRCSSSAPPAASGPTPCSSPSRRVRPSPASRARAKAQLVRDLGAADVIDYAHEDFADGSRIVRHHRSTSAA